MYMFLQVSDVLKVDTNLPDPSPLPAPTADQSPRLGRLSRAKSRSALLAAPRIREFLWSYNSASAGPTVHLGPVLLDGVLHLTVSSHAKDQELLDRFMDDMHAILTEIR